MQYHKGEKSNWILPQREAGIVLFGWFFYKILPFYAKNLLLQRNIEIRRSASGLASYYNANNLNCFLGENPNTACFGACKLWLILFGILLFPTEVFRWAGLELIDTVFKGKETFLCFKTAQICVSSTSSWCLLWGENTFMEKLPVALSKREGLVLCLMTFHLS